MLLLLSTAIQDLERYFVTQRNKHDSAIWRPALPQVEASEKNRLPSDGPRLHCSRIAVEGALNEVPSKLLKPPGDSVEFRYRPGAELPARP